MKNALSEHVNPRHQRPNRIVTNDEWSKPILAQIAKDTGAHQQEVVRNVLRKGLRAMGYGNPPEDQPSAEDASEFADPVHPSHYRTEVTKTDGSVRAVTLCTPESPCEECAAGHA